MRIYVSIANSGRYYRDINAPCSMWTLYLFLARDIYVSIFVLKVSKQKLRNGVRTVVIVVAAICSLVAACALEVIKEYINSRKVAERRIY